MKFSRPHLDSIRAMQLYQVLRQSGLILVAICMAKGLLSNEEIGNWELLTFLGFSATFFWLDGLLKTFIADREESSTRGDQLFQIYGMVMFAMALIGLLFFLGKDYLIPLIMGQDEISFLTIFTGYLFLNVPISILPAYYLIQKRNLAILILGIILFLGPPLCILLTLALGSELEWMYWAFFVFSILLHCILVWEMIRLNIWKWSIKQANHILKIAWPLMLYAIAVSMAKVFDGWLVSWYYRDEATFAIFRYGAREFPLTVALTAGMTLAFMPMLQVNRTEALQEIRRRSVKVMHLLFPLICGIMLISPWIFRWVFNSDFESSALIFNVYLLLVLSQVLFPHAVLLADQKNKIILFASLIELIVNIVLSVILIQYWGLRGVAVATVIAYFIEKLLFGIYLKRVYQIHPKQYLNLTIYSIYFTLTLLIFLMSLYL